MARAVGENMFKLIVNGKEIASSEDREKLVEYFEKFKHDFGKEAHTIHHEERIIHHDTQYDNSGNMVGVVIAEAWDEIVPAEYTYIIEDHTAEVEAERIKKETKHNDHVSRVDQLKAINWNTIDTIAELKAIVRILAKEAIKDDE